MMRGVLGPSTYFRDDLEEGLHLNVQANEIDADIERGRVIGRCAEFQCFHSRYMSEGTLSVFSELVSILTYRLAMSGEHYARPTTIWDPYIAILSYREHEVDMEKFYGMVRHLTEVTERIVGELVYAKPAESERTS